MDFDSVVHDGDTDSPVMSGRPTNRIGMAAGALGITSALYTLLILGGGFPGWPWSLLGTILAILLGVIGTMKGRRHGLPIAMAVTGLSLGLLTMLMFAGALLLLFLAWGH